MRRLRTEALVACALALAALGCPGPLTEAMRLRIGDNVAPIVIIESPVDGSPYAKVAVVKGRVSDAASAAGHVGQVSSISWELVPSTIPGGSLETSPDGAFSFQFPTSALGGTVVVKVRATDWNGNTGSAAVTIVNAGNDIPSFRATPSNGAVTLSWDPAAVPHATRYTLHYTTTGAIPSAAIGSHLVGVTPPVVIDSLPNGSLCGFLLEAETSDGLVDLSGIEQAIPLSPTTLMPVVHGAWHEICLEWPDIPGATAFEIQRRKGNDVDFLTLATAVHGTTYTDREIQEGQIYHYRVKPDGIAGTESESAWGVSCPFPKGRIEAAGHIGRAQILNEAISLVIDGSFAYVVSGGRLLVYDFSDPDNPALAGSLEFNYAMGPQSLAIRADVLYAVAGSQLHVLDISDPSNPSLLGSFYNGMEAQSVCVVDAAHVAIAYGTAGVGLVDVADPATPALVDLWDTPGQATSVAWDETMGRFYVADGTAGLSTIERATGAMVTCATGGTAVAVAFTAYLDNFVCLAQGKDGIAFVRNAGSNPVLAAMVDTPGAASDVRFSEGYFYVADGSMGFQVFEYSDRYSGYTRLPGRCATEPDAAVDARAIGACKDSSGNACVILADSGDPWALLKAFRLGPDRPVPVLDAWLPAGGAGAVASDGERLFVGSPQGMQVLDLGTGALIAEREVPEGGYSYSLLLSGSIAFRGYGDFGDFSWSKLECLDVSDPCVVSPLYRESFEGIGGICAQWGDILGIAGSSGMTFLDISRPSSPQVLGHCALPGQGIDIAMRGTYAYIACMNGLCVVDYSDPARPRLLSRLAIDGLSLAIALSGDYVLLGGGADPFFVYVIDVKDPQKPNLLSSVNTFFNPLRIHVSGSYAYVTEFLSCWVEVIDLSSPALPCAYGGVFLPVGVPFSGGGSLVVIGNTLYVNTTSKAAVVDLSP